MDFEAWNIDLNASRAFHVSGFRIIVEGDPVHPIGVLPSHFPDELSAVEQAELIRSGLRAFISAAKGDEEGFDEIGHHA